MKLWRVEHFWTLLSSLLGVIAIVFSNHAQKWRQKVFNLPEFHFSEVTSFKIGTLIKWIFAVETIQGRKLFMGGNY